MFLFMFRNKMHDDNIDSSIRIIEFIIVYENKEKIMNLCKCFKEWKSFF